MSLSNRSDSERLRDHISVRKTKFDTKTLPKDLQRVVEDLTFKYHKEYVEKMEKKGNIKIENDSPKDLEARERAEETALQYAFVMETAIELHRSWHMTLPTNSILQQIKNEFRLRMTWQIGVDQLKFSMDDGEHDLIRKVKYDYDSESQDSYMKIALAVIDRDITVHEALIFIEKNKDAEFSGRINKFLRKPPGRLILYPWKAAMYTIVFFGGDFRDAGIAAICGCFGGFIEVTLKNLDLSIIKELTVGISTGVIGGLFFYYQDESTCLRAIFMATLHWYFFGTAFVVGLLEILVGQLETGVTRFVAVTVKTFVLSLGACLGLMITTANDAYDTWIESSVHCNTLNFREQWYRIPLYLLCCLSVLGKHRMPLSQYLRALFVQYCAYESQFQVKRFYSARHLYDNLDVSLSNIVGAAVAVLSACMVSVFVNRLRYLHYWSLLNNNPAQCGTLADSLRHKYTKIAVAVGIANETNVERLLLEKRVKKEIAEKKDPNHNRQDVTFKEDEEKLMVENLVTSHYLNLWALLTPSLYQLVPGSLIARLWFDTIFPPGSCGDSTNCDAEEDVFPALINISVSLSLGLIIGFVLVEIFLKIMWVVAGDGDKDERDDIVRKVKGMYSVPKEVDESDESDESDKKDEKPENDHDPLQNNKAKPPSPLSPPDDVPSPIRDSQTFFDTISFLHDHEDQSILPQDRDSS